MSSDPPASEPSAGTDLDRLSSLLADLGLTEPGPVELAELLWLAARSGEDGTGAYATAPRPGRRRDDGVTDKGGKDGTEDGSSRTDGQMARTALHLPSDDPADGMAAAAAVPTPSAPMLARPLALQRALRPLKRQVPDPKRPLLDETATANRLAEALRGPGPVRWLPVLRAGTERWLDLHLVLDCGPTMAVWRPLALELRTLLRQTGAFRQVGLSCLDDSGRLTGRRSSDARTAVLVLSDCMGPQWRPGPPGIRWHRTLHRLARRSPVAVVQPLPERLWQLAALPAVAGMLAAPEAGAPNSAYVFAPFTDSIPAWDEVAVPVLEPGAGWLANWARLVGSPAGGQVVGSALVVGASPAVPEVDAAVGPEPDELAAAELVLRFRSVASPEAFTLAGLTALTTPALPVMRLLQRASFARPQPQHLAEVVVSGLLKEREGRRDHFEFRSGVRELMLRTLPRSTTHQAVGLLARVGEQIAARAGRVPNEFAALAATDSGGTAATAEQHAFALVSPAALRMLDGPREPVQQMVPQPVPGPVTAQVSPPALPDPARSRAVLLLTTSRSAADEPLGEDDLRAQRDVTALADALADPALVGLDPDHVWTGVDDFYGFRRALREAVADAEDTLLVYVGGAVAGLPGDPLALRRTHPSAMSGPELLDLSYVLEAAAVGRARSRLVVFDGWQEPEPDFDSSSEGSVVHRIISVRPRGDRPYAGLLNQALRLGQPEGPAELTVDQLHALALGRLAESGHSVQIRQALYQPTFLLSRNPAAAGRADLRTSQGGLQAARRPTAQSHSRQPRAERHSAGAATPYFFLSHAGGPQAYDAVERLFDDLSEEIVELTDLPAGVPAGFMDLWDRPDPDAELRTAEALATCRVFVPLYSPGYFQEERCGREWSAFAQRSQGRPSGIVPVLWQPVRRDALPEVAGRLLYVDSSLGFLYASEGLFGLAGSQALSERYELAVHRLAVRIVEVAHTARIPTVPRPDWGTLGSAFG